MRFSVGIVAAICAFLAMTGLAHALVKIDIDLTSQTMHVASRDGARYDWPISSGGVGHLTPQGRFRPTGLFPMVYSSKYNNAPMPHSIFFYGPYAIHGTTAVASLGRPVSHGCIRLAPASAATLYAKVESEGAAISIIGAAPTATSAAAAHRGHRETAALGYAPNRRARALSQGIAGPLGPR